ncbi:hypothetical protein [Tsukamurella soli]
MRVTLLGYAQNRPTYTAGGPRREVASRLLFGKSSGEAVPS